MAWNRLSPSTNAAVQTRSPKIVSLPSFTRSFTYGGITYPYTMVGHDPARRRTTVVPTTYIPLSFFFDEFVDQNGNNIVIDATAITDQVKNSPLFEKADYATGHTQYVDAQMRAQFWHLFQKKGDSDDDYHVLFSTPETLIPVVIEVPFGSSLVGQDDKGTFYAEIDINFLNSQLNTLVQTEPLTVQSVPIFLTRNAFYADFNSGLCCIGGFHGAYESSSTPTKISVQTFAFATSFDSDVALYAAGDPGFWADINALSHELGELVNDPFGNNATPAYIVPGAPGKPPANCQDNLEVGDNIENLTPDWVAITTDGFTYHPQTLSLLQWYEGITPSDAIDGDYSFPDPTRLTTPFAPCK